MKQFFRNNGGLLLVAAVLALGSYILGFDPLSGALEVLATPFRAASSAVTNWTQAQYDKAFRYEELAAENEALRQRVAELERDAIAGQDAQRENERMKDLLGLAEARPELQYRDAAVTRRSSSNWTSDLTIDRGLSGGVEVNDCVIDGHILDGQAYGWEITPTLSWNLFDGYYRKNQEKIARETLQEGLDNYNITVLNAYQETSDALSSYSSTIKQIDLLGDAVNQARKTLTQATDNYKIGLCDFQNVTDAQNTLMQQQNALAQARRNALVSLVKVYVALGGGWDESSISE